VIVVQGEWPKHAKFGDTMCGAKLDLMSEVKLPASVPETAIRLGARRLRPHLSSTRLYAKMPAVVSQFSSEDLRSIFEYADIGIAIRGLHGEWISCNEHLCKMLGYSRFELMQLTSVQLTPPDQRDLASDYNQRMIRGEISRYSREKEYLHKSGRRLPVQINVTVIKDDAGRPSHIVSVIEDISDVVEARRILQDYQKKLVADVDTATAELKLAKDAAEMASRTKSALLANMNHELRTPLNAIIGFSELLASKNVAPSGSQPVTTESEYASYINDAGHSLLEIINNILEIAKLEDGQSELTVRPECLNDLVTDVVDRLRPVAAQCGAQIRTYLNDELPRYLVDGSRIRYAIRCVVDNAIKFSKANGVVEVRLVGSPTGSALISISDSGIGLGHEHFDRVFEAFFQVDSSLARRHNGAGLGLTLAKKFVGQHGGSVTLTSELNLGTTVTIELPRTPSNVPGDSTCQ